MKPKVLISPDTLNIPEQVSKKLEEYAEVVYVTRPYDEHLHDAVAVLVGTEPIGDEYLDKAPKLGLVARFGVGYDSVDVEACTKRGIFVTHTPDVLSSGVADHTWALILGFMRRIPEASIYTKTIWAKRDKRFPFGYDMENKTLGILGLGRIGTEVLKRAPGFDLNLIYNDVIRRKDLEERYGIKYVEFDELMKQSDILTIHVSLQESTRRIINEKSLTIMKPSAIIINTSRGPVIDEKSLTRALKNGKLRGAALDVYEAEPTPLDNPLLKLDNVILTPHIASASYGTRKKMAKRSTRNVLAFLKGERPPHVVPEQKDVSF